ncbi:hypothetical protein [Burkholderia sp. PU8-34]
MFWKRVAARVPRWHVPLLVLAAFTAGPFEECGRWAALRYLLAKHRHAFTAVMIGLETYGRILVVGATGAADGDCVQGARRAGPRETRYRAKFVRPT